MTTNTAKFAQRELEILVASATDPGDRPIIEPFIPEILALTEKFGLSGQSGGSAPYTAGVLAKAIKLLCLQEPICPIMGIDQEWTDVTEISDLTGDRKLFQNNRCSALFKEENGKPYYLDAISFKDQDGICLHSNNVKMPDGNTVRSRQYIKEFPFTPKTFYIDVIAKEVAPDDWELHIKNPRQLQRVWKYYDKYE